MLLADPIREKIMNALADSDLDCADWHDDALSEIADLVLRVIVEELYRGTKNALPR